MRPVPVLPHRLRARLPNLPRLCPLDRGPPPRPARGERVSHGQPGKVRERKRERERERERE